jgi:predicted permease
MARPPLLDGIRRDLRYGARILFRNPVFSIVAIASLALGIGGAVSVFTVMNAVLLRMLPVPNPQQLFLVADGGEWEGRRYAWPEFEQLRNELQGEAELCAFTTATGMQVRPHSNGSTADRAFVQLVSGEYFTVLRQQPQVGRLLQPEDNLRVDAHPVAVISDAFWERHYGRSAAAVGREIVVNGASLTIVGVAAREFFGPIVSIRNPEVWVPLVMQSALRYASNASDSNTADVRKPWPPQRDIAWLSVLARLTDPEEAASIAAALTLHHQRDALSRLTTPTDDERRRIASESIRVDPAVRGVSRLREDLGRPLTALLGMVAVLLAIACGNLAGLLLSRASARDREIAIRLSIGASRARVIRQLLAETLMLAAAGGALGLLVAAWGRDLLLTMVSSNTTIDLDTAFDWRVLGFAVGLTTIAGVAAGLGPAIRSTRIPLAEAMKAQSRSVGVTGVRGARVGRILVAAQIAFCLLLLVLAGLFSRSMRSLMDIDVGYDRDALLVARVDVRSVGYAPDQRQALYARLLEASRSMPGVASASLSLNGPMASSQRISSLRVEGYEPPPGERIRTNEEIVTDDYFATVGLEIVEGRGFAPGDRVAGARSTVINQAMARRFFPAGGAVGKRWSHGDPIDSDSQVIVGVIEDAKYLDLRGAAPNMAYSLSASRPEEVLRNLEVRTSVPPSRLTDTLKKVLAETEPALPVYDIVPLEVRVNRGISNDRLVARLTAAFGVGALLLSCLGLYGTISYGVSRRVTELGVRMALGAARADVLWLVLREAAVLVLAGALVGIPLAYAAGRSAGSLLYGVRALDPAAYGIATAALVLVASLAAFLPAHRASRIDPMAALRKD